MPAIKGSSLALGPSRSVVHSTSYSSYENVAGESVGIYSLFGLVFGWFPILLEWSGMEIFGSRLRECPLKDLKWLSIPDSVNYKSWCICFQAEFASIAWYMY